MHSPLTWRVRIQIGVDFNFIMNVNNLKVVNEDFEVSKF